MIATATAIVDIGARGAWASHSGNIEHDTNTSRTFSGNFFHKKKFDKNARELNIMIRLTKVSHTLWPKGSVDVVPKFSMRLGNEAAE